MNALCTAMRDRSPRQSWRATHDPTLITVLLEASVALASLVIASGGLALAHLTRNAPWDAVASVTIGVILIGVAIALTFENHSLLIGESAPEHVEARIRGAVEADEIVAAVVSLHTSTPVRAS